MKKLFIFPVLALAVACQNAPKDTSNQEVAEVKEEVKEEAPAFSMYGAEISPDGAVGATAFLKQLGGNDSVDIKMAGTINEVCQVKGCWMTMDVEGQSMRVKFRDYGFFVPKDASGNEVVIEGTAYIDTISVADLKHYAMDAGDTQEEIDAITEPEVALEFIADGVMIKGYQPSEDAMEEDAHDHDHEEEGMH